jgi:hypothetical protein
MIPLTVCSLDNPIYSLMAFGIIIFAIIVGFIGAKLLFHRPVIFTIAFLIIMSVWFPMAAELGLPPFDSSWRQDCGHTPDPNVLVYFALLSYPLIVLLSGFISRRILLSK